MDGGDILRAYDAEVRANPTARTGFEVVREDGLVLLKGPFAFVSWWRLKDDAVDGAVSRLVERARSTRIPIIWRVFEHDQPPALPPCLMRNGFVPDPPGTLMIFDLQQSLLGPPVPGEVRRAVNATDVDDYLSVVDAVFHGDDARLLKSTYIGLLDDPYFSLFTAYVDGLPVAAGRLETGPDRQFGALFGGGVQTGYRHQGLYRLLVQARADEARRLGLRYLATEARETSRPILERMGFLAVARETTWLLATDQDRSVAS